VTITVACYPSRPVSNKIKTILSLIVLGIATLPLPLYPAVFLASLMSLAGHSSGTESSSLLVVSRSFLIMSLLYPIVYVASLIAYLYLRKKTAPSAFWISSVPLIYLSTTIVLFFAWGMLGESN